LPMLLLDGKVVDLFACTAKLAVSWNPGTYESILALSP